MNKLINKLSKMQKKYKVQLTYLMIMALQLAIIVYWAGCKVNYHIDELYSMRYAKGFAGGLDSALYITTGPEFKFGEWINNSVFKSYLTVSDGRSVFNMSVLTVLWKLLTGRTYYGLLNISESILGYTATSHIPGLILNVLLFILAEISLISLLKELNIDSKLSVISVAMFGFSGYMISTVEYVRFYMFAIMLMIVILKCFFRLWRANTWKEILLWWVLTVILSFISHNNSEFTLPFLGFFFVFFIIALILRRKWRQLAFCAGLILMGCIYILPMLTRYISVLIDPYAPSNQYGALTSMMIGIRNPSVSVFLGYFEWLRQVVTTLYFGNVDLIYLFAGVITIYIMVVFSKEGNSHEFICIKRINPSTGIALILWTCISCIAFLRGHHRAVSLLVLSVVVLIAIFQVLGYKQGLKKPCFSECTVFVAVLLGAVFLYTIFEALCELRIWRYYCYGFLCAHVILWYAIDRWLKRISYDKIRRGLTVILAIFVAANALLPFKTRLIENMYEDDRTFIDNVGKHTDLDVILMLNTDGGVVSRHDTYDCVNMMPDKTRVFAVDLGEYEYNKVDYPNKFMLWSHSENDLTDVLVDLKKEGYRVEELGTDHCSRAFVCSR